MACNCDKAPEFPTPAFIPGPIEIPINYRAVTIPADQGDDTTNPPLNGAYRNVVLKYAANNHVYIYSSDGIPVMLVGGINFDEIANRPLYDGEPMTSDTNIPDLTDEVATLQSEIEALATDFSYKGSVEDYDHLPDDAAIGDVYTTLDTGIIYVWDGNQWVALNEVPENEVVSVYTDTVIASDVPLTLYSDEECTNAVTIGSIVRNIEAGKSYQIIRIGDAVDEAYLIYPVISARDDGTLEDGRFGVHIYDGHSLFYLRADLASATELTVSGKLIPSDILDEPGSSYTAVMSQAGVTNLINTNAGAPTSATEGSVGQLLEDTTNGKLYICTDATNPYVWEEVGGGPNVVQTTGTSTTDVMSQDATSKMVFRTRGTGYPWDPTSYVKYINIGGKDTQTTVLADGWGINIGGYGNGGTSRQISDASVTIGHGTYTAGRGDVIIGKPESTGINSNLSNSVVIGNGAGPSGSGASLYRNSLVTIGYNAQVPTQSITGAVAIGACSYAQANGEMNIGSTNTTYGYNSSNYRLLTGLYDPINAHDAATKGYVDSVAGGGTFPVFIDSTLGAGFNMYKDAARTQSCTFQNILDATNAGKSVVLVRTQSGDTIAYNGVQIFSSTSDGEYYLQVVSSTYLFVLAVNPVSSSATFSASYQLAAPNTINSTDWSNLWQ